MEVFSAFGNIKEIVFGESKINGKSRGFAKIFYEEEGSAYKAFTEMNGKQPFRDNDDTNIIVAFPDFSKRPNPVNTYTQSSEHILNTLCYFTFFCIYAQEPPSYGMPYDVNQIQ